MNLSHYGFKVVGRAPAAEVPQLDLNNVESSKALVKALGGSNLATGGQRSRPYARFSVQKVMIYARLDFESITVWVGRGPFKEMSDTQNLRPITEVAAMIKQMIDEVDKVVNRVNKILPLTTKFGGMKFERESVDGYATLIVYTAMVKGREVTLTFAPIENNTKLCVKIDHYSDPNLAFVRDPLFDVYSDKDFEHTKAQVDTMITSLSKD